MAKQETSNSLLGVVVIGIIALVIIMSMLRAKQNTNVFIPENTRKQEIQTE